MSGEPTQAVPADQGAAPALTERFYAELRGIAHRLFAHERAAHTLQPTAVVNEACLRLMRSSSGGLPDLPREQQLALAARVLKQVLIDHARSRDAKKRSASGPSSGSADHASTCLELAPDTLDAQATQIEVLAIHRALERLRSLSERQAEIVTLRVFGGLTMEQAATVLGVSKRTAEGDWTVAKAWLRRELAGSSENG